MSLSGSTNAEKIWNFCKSKGMTDCGCAGVLGNMDCESGLNPINMEDQYQCKLGYTDETYTSAVDSGKYTNFVNDAIGFGLCQWTWHTRKRDLYEFVKSRCKSIGDLESQLDFFYKELVEKFPSVLNTLMTAASVLQASNAMLLKFECPADQSASMQSRRASFSQKYYDRFAGKSMEVKYNMGYVTVKKGSNTKLSEHFSSNEFDCHGGGCCSTTTINEKLVEYLEKIRTHFNKPITITSGYRCVIHNSRIGGAAGSRHTKGDAADIVVAGITPKEVAKYAESIGIKGIGLYETSADGHFVHIDTRDSKSFWYGQACSPRTTFGGASDPVAPQHSSSNTKTYAAICYGNKGQTVKELQEKLIQLGYSCGKLGADGSFGTGTLNAVKSFQKNSGLLVDGIAGVMTIAEIDKRLSEKSVGETYTVTANLLNVRSGDGTNYKIVATLARGSTVLVTEEKNGWGKISVGWVSMQYLRKG